MAYTKVNWANGSGGGTPMSAANLGVMDQGIYDLDNNTVKKDGSVTITPPATGQQFSVTLGAATKEIQRWVATDGKTYAWRLTASNEVELYNVTDSVSIFKAGPTSGTLTAGGNTVWHAGNDGAGSGLDADKIKGRAIFVQASDPAGSAATGDVWIKDA
jgi:hypothetical protein